MRCFIAIELPEHVKSKIFHEFENLQKKNLFVGKFVEKENLHLTLKFLGEISEERIDTILKKLKDIKLKKFNCEIGKSGFFDNENHIKVLWVDLISESNKMKELQKQISDSFPEISSDYKRFISHITIARVKSVINKPKLIKEIKRINFKNLKFEVCEFILMKSELMKTRKTGPKYKILERFKLEI